MLIQPQLLTTPWPVIQVALRWDGWADWPDDEDNEKAIENAKSGSTYLHARYRTVDLYAQEHTIWQDGSTTYLLTTAEAELPIYRNSWFLSPNFESVVRKRVEAGYNRPAADKPPVVNPTQNWFWELVLYHLDIPNEA
ncbi:PE-PPE domain-containing protein [uncultured Mycolicibacterium sp.]|uniref:PE-PPE domain-containing protein n=1 Tax=uncultured Mycolicibacterium sp. TaxID=2320817 RepID=UPI0032B2CCFC